jgi:cobalt/nickel transport system permease protein
VSHALARSLRGISERLEQSLVAEEISRRKGWLQTLDARVKLLTILALIIAVSLARSLAVLAGLYMIALFLAWASAISLGFFIRRVWLALPFFTGVVALPALFLTPGIPLVHLPLGLVVTQSGAMTVLYLLLRVGTSFSLALLLVLTTPWAALLRALTVLRVPDVAVLMLGMTYRYIYVLLSITNDMFLSRQSRVVGRLSSAQERSIEAAIAGTLLAQSLHVGGEVYLAMQSRGFRGHAHALRSGEMAWRDYAWLAMAALIVVATLVVGRWW